MHHASANSKLVAIAAKLRCASMANNMAFETWRELSSDLERWRRCGAAARRASLPGGPVPTLLASEMYLLTFNPVLVASFDLSTAMSTLNPVNPPYFPVSPAITWGNPDPVAQGGTSSEAGSSAHHTMLPPSPLVPMPAGPLHAVPGTDPADAQPAGAARKRPRVTRVSPGIPWTAAEEDFIANMWVNHCFINKEVRRP